MFLADQGLSSFYNEVWLKYWNWCLVWFDLEIVFIYRIKFHYFISNKIMLDINLIWNRNYSNLLVLIRY